MFVGQCTLEGVVIPVAALHQRGRRTDGYATQRGNTLGDGVHHFARGLDLRVEHLVHRDEIGSHNIPVHVL